MSVALSSSLLQECSPHLRLPCYRVIDPRSDEQHHHCHHHHLRLPLYLLTALMALWATGRHCFVQQWSTVVDVHHWSRCSTGRFNFNMSISRLLLIAITVRTTAGLPLRHIVTLRGGNVLLGVKNITSACPWAEIALLALHLSSIGTQSQSVVGRHGIVSLCDLVWAKSAARRAVA